MCWCPCGSRRSRDLHIESLRVSRFRNIEQLDLSPSPCLTVVTGANGQGKTSLLEALYVLGTGGSFRTGNDAEMVQKGREGYYIASCYDRGGRSLECSLAYDALSGSKQFCINQKKAAFNDDKRLNLVSFSPDDLFLVKGLPGKRRAFLDFILVQLSGEYARSLQQYRSLLKKRNEIIKSGSFNDKISESLDPVMAEKAARIILARVNMVNTLNEIICPLFTELDSGSQGIYLKYALSFPLEEERINLSTLEKAMLHRLQDSQEKEARLRRTLCGPQVDDLHFYYQGQNARIFASQGQQRNLVVSLKIAEVLAFFRIKQIYPVLLLDEVLAELDDRRREKLIKYLEEAPFQTLLSSVEEVDRLVRPGTGIYRMSSGVLQAAV